MSTLQTLTTEQLELLILINDIEEYGKKHPENIPQGGIKEVLWSSNLMDEDKLVRITNVLKYYRYIDKYFELTVDGKQYIELFEEYLEQKAEDVKVEHVSFSLLNIEKLDMSLLDSIAKISILDNVGSISKLLSVIVQGIKSDRHK